jgi:hypothetical protein
MRRPIERLRKYIDDLEAFDPQTVQPAEKGGKRHAMPCHHNLDEYLIAYLDGADLRDDPSSPVRLLPQANADAMIRRRVAAARIETKLGNHISGDGDHCLSKERRHVGKSCGDGEPCIDVPNSTLRSPARRGQPR